MTTSEQQTLHQRFWSWPAWNCAKSSLSSASRESCISTGKFSFDNSVSATVLRSSLVEGLSVCLVVAIKLADINGSRQVNNSDFFPDHIPFPVVRDVGVGWYLWLKKNSWRSPFLVCQAIYGKGQKVKNRYSEEKSLLSSLLTFPCQDLKGAQTCARFWSRLLTRFRYTVTVYQEYD